MNKELDSYSFRLSIKEEIAYEEARNLIEQSMERLKEKNYNSDNFVKSAYKYSRNKISKDTNNHNFATDSVFVRSESEQYGGNCGKDHDKKRIVLKIKYD